MSNHSQSKTPNSKIENETSSLLRTMRAVEGVGSIPYTAEDFEETESPDTSLELLQISGLLCYFVAATTWLAVAIWAEAVGHDTIEPSVLGSAASCAFMIYGTLLLYRWFLLRKQPITSQWYGGGIPGIAAYTWDWDLPIVVTFWFGTLGDLTTSLLECHTFLEARVVGSADFFKGSGLTDIFASHFWFISGFLELVKYYLNLQARKYHGSPVHLTLVPFPTADDTWYDWQGAGALFFFPGALGYAVGAYICIYCSFNWCWASQMVGALGFLADSICQLAAFSRVLPDQEEEESFQKSSINSTEDAAFSELLDSSEPAVASS